MIFLDTSAIYALADAGDPHHEVAKKRFQAILNAREEILTHNYVLVESMALIQHRLGRAAALKLAESSDFFQIEWVDKAIHEAAVDRLARSNKRISFVDHVSFLVMRLRGVSTVLAFDPHFAREGFRLCQGEQHQDPALLNSSRGMRNQSRHAPPAGYSGKPTRRCKS